MSGTDRGRISWNGSVSVRHRAVTVEGLVTEGAVPEMRDKNEPRWWKSSYSSAQGGNCVEVASSWWKSSYSGSKGGECVEVAGGHCHMHLRDSKNPGLGHLSFSSGEWMTFLKTAGLS